MWWFLCKKSDNLSEVVYTYGRETKEQSGEIRYDRKSETFEVVKLANNDTYKGANRLLPHLYHIIFKENCPEQRQIATG